MHRLARLFLCFTFLLAATPSPANAERTLTSTTVPWTCSTALLGDFKDSGIDDPDVGEGVSYLYAGDKTSGADYGADAVITAPLDGKRGWYDSAVRLGPYSENNAFVQIEISRWKRFGYREHVALSWSVAHGTVQYKDTGLMLAGSHRLGIYVHGGRVHLLLDERELCSTRAAFFVTPAARKYFQVRTETSVVGRNGNAHVSDLRLKRDTDAAPKPFITDCILHRNGVFWEARGRGAFVARGAFYPNEATFFTGADPSTPCRS